MVLTMKFQLKPGYEHRVLYPYILKEISGHIKNINMFMNITYMHIDINVY